MQDFIVKRLKDKKKILRKKWTLRIQHFTIIKDFKNPDYYNITKWKHTYAFLIFVRSHLKFSI